MAMIGKYSNILKINFSFDRVPLIPGAGVYVAHIAGTIEVDEKARMKKLMFRATRGKALTFFNDYTVRSANNEPRTKSVYIIMF
jgi:hypothetical protein